MIILDEDFTNYSTTTINKNGSLIFTAPFIQMEIRNGNGRLYPKDVVIPVVENYIVEKVLRHKATGELEHPLQNRSSINPDRITHLITNLILEGNNYIGTAKLLNTPCGNIVKALVEGGVSIGISTRGDGNVNNDNVVTEFKLITAADIVMDPSAPSALIALLESQNPILLKPYSDKVIDSAIKLAAKNLLSDAFNRLSNDFLNFKKGTNYVY